MISLLILVMGRWVILERIALRNNMDVRVAVRARGKREIAKIVKDSGRDNNKAINSKFNIDSHNYHH